MTDQTRQLIEAEKNAPPVSACPAPINLGQGEPVLLHNVTAETGFSKAVNDAKINIVKDASANDEKFVEELKSKLKDAAIKSAELEQEKNTLEKDNIEYQNELLDTQRKLNEHEQSKNSWESKQKRRQFHYDGVSPIMEFVGIKKAMNLFILYFLTAILIIPFLLAKLWDGTIGALLHGAEDQNRSKTARNFIWTLICFLAAIVTAILIYLALIWLKIV